MTTTVTPIEAESIIKEAVTLILKLYHEGQTEIVYNDGEQQQAREIVVIPASLHDELCQLVEKWSEQFNGNETNNSPV